MACGGETTVKGLVADGAAIPSREDQFAPGKFHRSPAQAHSFEAFEKDCPFSEGIRQARHERNIAVFPAFHLEPGGGELPCPVPDQLVRGKQRPLVEPARGKIESF